MFENKPINLEASQQNQKKSIKKKSVPALRKNLPYVILKKIQGVMSHIK